PTPNGRRRMALDSETFDQLLATVRRFVRERLVPNEHRVADTDALPDDIVAEMRSLGLFGLAIPPEYGGPRPPLTEGGLVTLEIGRTSRAFRSRFGTSFGIGAQGIVIDGTEEQKRAYLPRLAAGEITGSFALTEPDSGSDAASLRASAVRNGADYIL